MKRLFFIAFIIFIPSVVYSQPATFKVHGMFDMSCGRYVKEVTDDPEVKNAYSWWIAGFVTGANLEKRRVTSTDSAAHEAWILKYCQENPLDDFMQAASKLNKRLDTK